MALTNDCGSFPHQLVVTASKSGCLLCASALPLRCPSRLSRPSALALVEEAVRHRSNLVGLGRHHADRGVNQEIRELVRINQNDIPALDRFDKSEPLAGKRSSEPSSPTMVGYDAGGRPLQNRHNGWIWTSVRSANQARVVSSSPREMGTPEPVKRRRRCVERCCAHPQDRNRRELPATNGSRVQCSPSPAP
jgi:hypothetical protein